MNCHIAFLSDYQVHWPPSLLCDAVVAHVAEYLSNFHLKGFSHLSMYFHLLGEEPNSFGMSPGLVSLRLNRRQDEMIATWAVSRERYSEARDDNSRAALIVLGVQEVLDGLRQRFRDERIAFLITQLDYFRLQVESGSLQAGA